MCYLLKLVIVVKEEEHDFELSNVTRYLDDGY